MNKPLVLVVEDDRPVRNLIGERTQRYYRSDLP